MPAREQYQRIQRLDGLLASSPTGMSARQLLDTLNKDLATEDKISLRTLQNDLAALKEGQFGVQVALLEERRGRLIFYRYKEPGFSLYGFNLTFDEQAHIRQALALLERSGRYFLALEQLKRKISPLDAALPTIEFDDNPDYLGLQWMQKITEAIAHPTCLVVTYRPFEREAYPLKLHPYRLREYNNRWYLCGLAEPQAEPAYQTVLALDRMEKVEFCDDPPYFPSNFDPEYFEDVIGITVDMREPIQRIRLALEPGRAEYVRTKPLHRTQRGPYPATNGRQEFTIDVRHNRELIATILSFGSDIEVLEPDSLRAMVSHHLHNAAAMYA